ncbi:WD repeat-containing protein 27-like [Argonauta hians]
MASQDNSKSLQIALESSITTHISPSKLAVAANGQYIASLYSTPSQIGIWDSRGFSSGQNNPAKFYDLPPESPSPLLLLGQDNYIKCLALSKHVSSLSPPNEAKLLHLLCSVDELRCVVWNLNLILEQQNQVLQEGSPIGEIYTIDYTNCITYAEEIIPSYSNISYCVFSWHNEYIALCVDSDIVVIFIGSHLKIQQQYQISLSESDKCCRILKAHTSTVNGAEFHHRKVNILVSISDDLSYIVWDIYNGSMIYRDYLPYSMSAPIVLGLNYENDSVFVGTSNGYLVVINMSFPGINSNKIGSDSLYKITQSVNCSEIVTKKYDEVVNRDTVSPNPVESQSPVLSMCYLPHPMDSDRHRSEILLDDSPIILVCTNNSVLYLNAYTLECIDIVHLKTCNNELLGDLNTLNHMYAILICNNIKILTSNHFSTCLNISKIQPHEEVRLETVVKFVQNKCVSPVNMVCDPQDSSQRKYIIYPCTLLTETSILKSHLVPIKKIKMIHKSEYQFKPSVDYRRMPKNKVKSSGYLQPPHQKMFQPKINFHNKLKGLPPTSVFKTKLIQKDFNPENITVYKSSLQVIDKCAAITCMKISPNGKQLAVGSTNGSVVVLEGPKGYDDRCYVGHDKAVNSVNWSYNNKWLITTSDETAALWQKEKRIPLMRFTYTNGNFSRNKNTDSVVKDIKKAQFYYMDNFILLSASDSFHLYKYYLDTSVDDSPSYNDKSKYKSIGTFQSDGNCITDLAAINTFYSYMVLCSTTNRSVSVYDMNVGRNIQLITNVHPTVPYCLAMNSGSSYLSLPPNAYDLVLTAALKDPVKLWDIRSGKCVRKFEQHCNRAYTCRATFSPCGRYVLAGSEECTAYLYNIGEGVCYTKLKRHYDIVTDIAYNPFLPRLSTSTLNGHVYSFSSTQYP